MSEQAAFIRAICENPDDDTARLVYADWLQENGRESLAGFIRHQILTPVSPCRNAPLTALISLESLVGPYPHKYQTNVSGIGGATVTYPNGMVFWFTRGFVSCIELPCAALLTHAAAIFAQHPIESVRITDRNAAAYHHTLSDLPRRHLASPVVSGLRFCHW